MRRSGWWFSGVLIAWVFLVLPARGERFLVIRIVGDLDSAKLASEVGDAISAAGRVDGLVIETGADAWRRDVVWHIAEGVRQSGLPSVVFLRDRADGRFGTGALMLGVLADVCMVGADTAYRVEVDDEHAGLMPEAVDVERVDRELGGLLWVAFKRRGQEPALSEALLGVRTSLWVAPDPVSGLPTLMSEGDSADARRVLEVRPDGSVRGGLSASDLLGLGLADLEAGDLRRGMMELGYQRVILRTVEIRNEVSQARAQVLSMLREVDERIADLERSLDRVARPGDDRVVPAGAYRQAALRARPQLAEIARLIRGSERLFDAHPELLATPAPEGTPVGRTRERNVSDWRHVFLARRRALARLEETVRDWSRR